MGLFYGNWSAVLCDNVFKDLIVDEVSILLRDGIMIESGGIW